MKLSSVCLFSCFLITLLSVQAIAQPLNGQTYVYTHELVQHGEYEVDACQLQVIGANGVPVYSEFKGEYDEKGLLCGGLKLDESVSYLLTMSPVLEKTCQKLDSRKQVVQESSLLFCGL
jgi:hypothetical protein